MRREEKAITDRQAIPTILKKALTSRLAGFAMDTPVPELHGS